jgi:hypothetical protein
MICSVSKKIVVLYCANVAICTSKAILLLENKPGHAHMHLKSDLRGHHVKWLMNSFSLGFQCM